MFSNRKKSTHKKLESLRQAFKRKLSSWGSKKGDKVLVKRARKVLLGTELEEFLAYLKSPWRIMWTNLLAGIFRGLGILIGLTVVFALLIWLLNKFVDFPLIGQYFQAILDLLESVEVSSNYR
jgi:uncharacterized oligopeptide transporter (OPT) family protein